VVDGLVTVSDYWGYFQIALMPWGANNTSHFWQLYVLEMQTTWYILVVHSLKEVPWYIPTNWDVTIILYMASNSDLFSHIKHTKCQTKYTSDPTMSCLRWLYYECISHFLIWSSDRNSKLLTRAHPERRSCSMCPASKNSIPQTNC